MTKEEIIELARSSGMKACCGKVDRDGTIHLSKNAIFSSVPFQWLEHFAYLVAANEREQCAELAEETVCDVHIPTGYAIRGSKVAKAIRERK